MLKKMNFIWIGIISILCFSTCFAQNGDWIGKYEYLDDGMNAGGNRSYTAYHNLEIMSEDGFLTAIYESGENSSVHQKMKLTVESKGNTAFFYYDHCFTKYDDDTEPCVDTEKRGELMFKLVKSVNKNKKTVILTYGVKNDSLPKGKVFFKKIG